MYIKSIKVTHISFLPITVKEDKNERCLLFTGIFFNYLLEELEFDFFFNLGKRFEVFLLHHCTVNFRSHTLLIPFSIRVLFKERDFVFRRS